MRSIRAVVVLLIPFLLTFSAVAVEGFPAGTIQFVNTGTSSSAVPALGGGVWMGTSQGLVHFTEAGPGTVLPTPGAGTPFDLVLAPDGSIWFAKQTLIARMSPAGAILEQYPLAQVRALAVASDGALWYARLDNIVGRIAGGVPTEFPSPTQTWSLAPASNGDMWALGTGFATGTDSLYRMTPTGQVTVLPLGQDVLFGRLQALPDGTLYIGTGIRNSVLRLAPGAQVVDVVKLPGSEYLSDAAGNLWTGGYERLGYIFRAGPPHINVSMPGDPRECSNIPAYLYTPLAIDSSGGVWVRIVDDAAYIPTPIPCNEPEPPPMPDLIRIDATQFIASHVPEHIPTLSPAMLVGLAAALAFATIRLLR